MTKIIIADDVEFVPELAIGSRCAVLYRNGKAVAEVHISKHALQLAIARAIQSIADEESRECNVLAFKQCHAADTA